MSKAAPLVSQYVERVSRAAVEKYQDIFRDYVRGRQGVYALYRRNKLYYVGLASDLRWRLRHHLKDHHARSWDRFSLYFTIGETHLRELETLILHITGKPPGNKNEGNFRESENLRRRLKRDIKRFQRDELRELIGPEKTQEVRRALRETGRQPSLAAYIRGPMKLRATFKRRVIKARVRKDGAIRFGGRTYNSPSGAAGAATRGFVDGWYFWRFERAPGDWVRLNELRK